MSKIRKKYTDPVNYKLSDKDPIDSEEFTVFLDELTDVPESTPLHNIKINEAGITNQQVVVQIKDIDGRDFYVPTVCDVTLRVSLEQHRGIHMSRCEQVLFDAVKDKYDSLEDFAVTVAKGLDEKQSGEKSFVRVKGTYLHKRLTRKTKKESLDKLYLTTDVTYTPKKTRIETGVTAYNMTACPCTRTFTKYSVIPELRKLGFNLDQVQKILDITHSGTHTQRGLVSIKVEKTSKDMTHGNLYQILEKTCHLIYELLKRPDEHDLVVRALSKPQFTEDVVREVAYEASETFKKAPEDTKIMVESVLLDSIHIHDVCTKIEETLGELRDQIKQN